MLEADVENALVKGCKALGCEAVKLAIIGRKGWPDRTILMPSDNLPPWYVELKKPGGTLSEHQKQRIADLRDRGYFVAVVWNFTQVEELLARLTDHLTVERWSRLNRDST